VQPKRDRRMRGGDPSPALQPAGLTPLTAVCRQQDHLNDTTQPIGSIMTGS